MVSGQTLFNVNSNKLTQNAVKFNYRVGPPVPHPRTCLNLALSRSEGSRVQIIADNPSLGSQIIDPSGDASMEESPVAACDLNEDGKCDATDFSLLQNALGKCLEDFSTPADVRADVDGDGCVTITDQEMLVSFDSDSDGVLGFNDMCPKSDLSTTVVIDSCNSGVPNTLFPSGCTISDQVAKCANDARNHGQFVSCVAQLTNNLEKAGTITGRGKGAIQSCAAQAHIP